MNSQAELKQAFEDFRPAGWARSPRSTACDDASPVRGRRRAADAPRDRLGGCPHPRPSCPTAPAAPPPGAVSSCSSWASPPSRSGWSSSSRPRSPRCCWPCSARPCSASTDGSSRAASTPFAGRGADLRRPRRGRRRCRYIVVTALVDSGDQIVASLKDARPVGRRSPGDRRGHGRRRSGRQREGPGREVRASAAGGLLSGISLIGSLVATSVLALLLTFFFLRDSDRAVNLAHTVAPRGTGTWWRPWGGGRSRPSRAHARDRLRSSP